MPLDYSARSLSYFVFLASYRSLVNMFQTRARVHRNTTSFRRKNLTLFRIGSIPQHYPLAVVHVALNYPFYAYVHIYVANRAGCIGLLAVFLSQTPCRLEFFFIAISEAMKKVEGATTPAVERVEPLPLRHPAELKPVCAPAAYQARPSLRDGTYNTCGGYGNVDRSRE